MKARAGSYLGLRSEDSALALLQSITQDGRSATLLDGSLSLDPIPANQRYVVTADGVQLAWEYVLRTSPEFASLIGDRFGVMVYHPSLVSFSRAIIRRYGMEDRIVGFGVSGFDLPDLAAHHDEVVNNFVSEAKRLVADGAPAE